MDKLLKEAIADAKAVRETALANAKIALEEAFAPKLQSMLTAKINEEEEEEMETEEEPVEGVSEGDDYEDWWKWYNSLEEEDLPEGMSKEDFKALVDKFKSDPGSLDKFKKAFGIKEADDEEKMADDEMAEAGNGEEEEVETEALDLESIIRELEMEAKGEGEEETEEEPKTEAKEEGDEEDMDEEINLQELLAALSEADDEDEKEKKTEAKDEDEKEKVEEIARLRSELTETRNVVVFLKDKINEINLLNAKLLYTNKLFRNYSLNEAQKVKILESLDRTKSVREVKLIYTTLSESLSETKGVAKKKITESLGFASKKSGNTSKAILEEGGSLAARFQKLANINKK